MQERVLKDVEDAYAAVWILFEDHFEQVAALLS